MTETTTAKHGGLAWQIARRLLPASSPARQLPDWPEAFSPEELAALQYPREGTDPEKRKAMSNRRALVAALRASIDAGELEAVPRQETRPVYGDPPRRDPFVYAYPADDWTSEFRVRNFPEQVKVGEEIHDVQTIAHHPFAAWLQGESDALAPSVHVLAWLDDEWQAAPEPETDAGKVGRAQAEIRAILENMRTHDPELSLDKDGRLILPGQYAGFHGLCIGISRSKHEGKDPLFAVTTEHFKKDYCKGLCTVLQKGPPRADDRDYYLKLAGEMGVKWTQPQEPKPRAKSESK